MSRRHAGAIPFAVAEDFNPGEHRGFHGRWTPGSVDPHAAHARYEGGVVRSSAQARARLAKQPQISLKDLPGSVGRGKWSAAVPRVMRDLKAGRVTDTESAYKIGGKYTAERKALHEKILTNLLAGKQSHEGKARAIFTAGGPASGKSRMVSEGHVKLPADPVHVNPDLVREMLPEYQQLKQAGRADASQLTHEEASHISKLAMKMALSRQHHVLVDTVGDSEPGKFAGKIKDAQRAGHAVSVHYATVSTATAVQRAHARFLKTGRDVPKAYLRSAHQAVSQRFEGVAKLPGVHVQVFHTADAGTKLIAEKHAKADKIGIVDRGAFDAFLAKGKA